MHLLALLLLTLPFARAASLGNAMDRIEVVVDDEALGLAIVRSASSHFPGAMRLAKRGAPPGNALRFEVSRSGASQLDLTLSLGPSMRLTRSLPLRGSPSRFDMAESAALALSDMRSHLEERLLERSQTPLRPQRQASAPGKPAPTPSAPVPPDPEPEKKAEVPLPPIFPRTEAPHPAPPPAAAPPERASPLKLALGIPLVSIGAGALALGAASLMVDGQCVDQGCAERYAGKTAGSIELALGAAAFAAGTGLLVAELVERRRSETGRRQAMVAPWIGAAGLSCAGRF